MSDVSTRKAHGATRASRSHTRLDVAVDVKEAGAFLGRFGWPNAVKGAATKIDGQVSWDGAPSDFDYPTLSGNFKLRSGAGQFTKIDPGVGRCSACCRCRRCRGGSRSISATSSARDSRSTRSPPTCGCRTASCIPTISGCVGPAAAVNIAGDVDLAQETQHLKVRVQPSLSSGVSAGAAALFIANPLIGAAVGAGALLAQKMLNNPFDQLFSYEYAVTGSWDDPVVARTGAQRPAAAQSGATIRVSLPTPATKERATDERDDTRTVRVAAIQMTSGADVAENLRAAEPLGRGGRRRRRGARAAARELRLDGPATRTTSSRRRSAMATGRSRRSSRDGAGAPRST